MPATRPTISDKRRAFQQLHAAGCFAIPNPWDVGSARYLQSLGFQALASKGLADNGVSRDAVLGHLRDRGGKSWHRPPILGFAANA